MRNAISNIFATLIFSILVDEAYAFGTEIVLTDPYPTPELVGQVGNNTEISISLILGAALIVVIILGGVAFRRMKRS